MKLLSSLILALLFLGCAGLQPTTPEPSVSINSFNVVPSQGLAPRFEIGLKIINTSRDTLDVDGIVYTVELQGNKVLTGVAKDIPSIEAYSEANVSVSGSPDLFGSLGLMQDMMRQKSENIAYEVDVAIDVGAYYPIIHSTKTGEFSLAEMGKQQP